MRISVAGVRTGFNRSLPVHERAGSFAHGWMTLCVEVASDVDVRTDIGWLSASLDMIVLDCSGLHDSIRQRACRREESLNAHGVPDVLRMSRKR